MEGQEDGSTLTAFLLPLLLPLELRGYLETHVCGALCVKAGCSTTGRHKGPLKEVGAGGRVAIGWSGAGISGRGITRAKAQGQSELLAVVKEERPPGVAL